VRRRATSHAHGGVTSSGAQVLETTAGGRRRQRAELRVGTGGTGLGLIIARGLVLAMGGRIRVSSREGEGSRFAFELPAVAGRRVKRSNRGSGRV